MTASQEFLLVAGMMVVTFGVRYGVMAMSGRMRFPPWLESALRFVPVAVLSAICVPIMLMPKGDTWVSVDNEYLVAGVVAIAIAAVSRHLLLTIALGMVLFLGLRFWG